MSSVAAADTSNSHIKQLWENFQNICQKPRPSKHEEKMGELLKETGEGLGLETIVDEIGNVIIRKPATPGMENCKAVTMQCHFDMVPQKNSDVDHDFTKDPIQAYVDGEWVTAKGTTLGADNGIGVAAMLTVLQATDIKHGLIEALFTIDEEAGMTGSFGLKPDVLQGDILLNLDSEDEGEFCIGCAGGITTNTHMEYQEESVPADSTACVVNVAGLRGGHSGMDINSGRGNSNKILNRLLWQATTDYNLRIASVDGGSLANAIPREAVAVVTVPTAKVSEFKGFVAEFAKTVQAELSAADPELTITVAEAAMPAKVMVVEIQEKFLAAVYSCINGMLAMSVDMPEVIETSTNLARVHAENGVIATLSLQRSAIASKKQDLANMFKCAFLLMGSEVKQAGGYPGWKPNIDSEILRTCHELYKAKFGNEPKVTATHGGLECGLIGSTYPHLDMISFGPTIRNPHSPDEKVNIASVSKFLAFLLAVLQEIPEKG